MMRAIDQIAGPAAFSTGAREAINLPMHNSVAARIVSPAPFVIMSVVVVLFTIPMMLFITPMGILPVVMVDTASQGGYQKSQKYIPSTVHGTLLVERSNLGSSCFESRTQSAELRARAAGGPMHRVPSLQWKTWVRLAFVEAGSDWRSLNKLAVENGHLRDYLIVPEYRDGYMGVNRWDEPAGTIAGRSGPTNGAFSIADPRFVQSTKWNDGHAYGVLLWEKYAGTIAGQQSPGQGYYTVADPRHAGSAKHNNEFRIVRWASPAGAVTGAHGTGQCVQDPRAATGFHGAGKYRVTGYRETAGIVIARSDSG